MSIETMAQKLKMFREINGMSQEQLGEKLNVSEKTISAWENNDREINLTNAKLICELFNIPNSYFVFNENFEKISTKTQQQIKEYSKNLEIKCKIETIISVCKKKIESDKLLLKKEYLPVFDYDKKGFISYGIFDPRYLPVKAKRVSADSQQVNFGESISFNNIIDNMNSYRYDPSQLSKYNLYEVLKLQFDTLELKDLTECNCVEILKETALKMKERRFYDNKNVVINVYDAQRGVINKGVDITDRVIQDQLNYTLENLNPNLSKYWEIIVSLIDMGAYYTKQVGNGTDVICWSIIKDVSKTNFIYRCAKDKIN